MAVLDFFKRNKKTKTETETVRTKNPSPEQLLFANIVLDIISPSVENYGFIRHKIVVETYSTNIVFRKDKQFIKVYGSTYPTDYPFSYNIILGEGDSEDFFEWDWNSIALWRLKAKINPDLKAQEYPFPTMEKTKESLIIANDELLKYGLTFLMGDLSIFYDTRSEQNKDRDPYKIHSPDKDGKYKTTDEPRSVKQKKKYS